MLNEKESATGVKLLISLIIIVIVTVLATVFAETLNSSSTEAECSEISTTETDICPVTVTEPDEPDTIILSDEEINLIALVVMAEAEGECELGKRLVIDTILNRVDSEYWPDTVSEVIWQPDQFTSMWNGRADRCYVRDDICQLVMEELTSRTNHYVVYFTAGKYGRYGRPLLQIGNHYFSSYE
jgi:N-acetylmuramoyl-L-alanine amidase